MKLRSLFRYFLLPLYKPGRGICGLYEEHRMLGHAVIVYLFLGVTYTTSLRLACMRGFGAVVEPFVRIPAERYCFWQHFYQIPFFLVTGVVFAGTAGLLAVAFGEAGRFEQVFGLSSYGRETAARRPPPDCAHRTTRAVK